MLDLIRQPWPWYASGFAISAIMVLLLYFGKSFGFSSNLRTICSMAGAGSKSDFFDFDWKGEIWNLLFLVGSILGGYIVSVWLNSPAPLQLSETTITDLHKLGISFDGGLNPDQLFGRQILSSPKTILLLLAGGVLVGFGSRYAGGCTSGHAISGLSNLQIPSLIAVVGFFIGGLAMTHLIFPVLFKL
ncbi:YeeE/YedE family protein [Dyadobacter sandarakinus]|uniref:YeeE/YedE family protein n=3 Tax=Spirosomataceae TaxID=2896860 RepID=A0A5R9KZP1_9BACT|nr:YeeE/YedE family protein [Dyadobacter sandarakinus]TLV01618.1 YeeE/YedE family protein [Dyadobacter luticola]